MGDLAKFDLPNREPDVNARVSMDSIRIWFKEELFRINAEDKAAKRIQIMTPTRNHICDFWEAIELISQTNVQSFQEIKTKVNEHLVETELLGE